MLSVAPLLREHDARRTGLVVRVAVVRHWMSASPVPHAGRVAGRRAGAARHRRVQHLQSAVAVQLVEADVHAGGTLARVTALLAAVAAAAQAALTEQRARVVRLDAARAAALVPPARAPLCAAPLAERVVGPGRQLPALHLLVHLPAAAPHLGRHRTRRALLLSVAEGLTGVAPTCRAALEQLSARLSASGDRIGAAISLGGAVSLVQLLQFCLPARAVGDLVCGQLAWLA